MTSVVAILLTAQLGLGLGLSGGLSPRVADAASKRPRSNKPSIAVAIGPGETSATAIVAELYAQVLEARGMTVKRVENMTVRETSLAAMERGQLDLYPERTNSLLGYLNRTTVPSTAVDAGAQMAELRRILPQRITVLPPSRAEDGPAIVCNAATVKRHRLISIDGLARNASAISIGGPPGFETAAPFGVAGLRELLRAEFAAFIVIDNVPAVVTALRSNITNCAALTTTHASLVANGFVALDDTVGMVADEVVVPLVTKSKATPAVVATIAAVNAVLTTSRLAALVTRVEGDRVSRATAAKEFLQSHRLTS